MTQEHPPGADENTALRAENERLKQIIAAYDTDGHTLRKAAHQAQRIEDLETRLDACEQSHTSTVERTVDIMQANTRLYTELHTAQQTLQAVRDLADTWHHREQPHSLYAQDLYNIINPPVA